MVQNMLLSLLLLPTLAVPVVYLIGKKSAKAAAVMIALISLAEIALLATSVPTILNGPDHRYVESYYWIPVLNSSFTLFVDWISLSMAIVTLVLIFTAALFSISYMQERKGLAEYYALFTLLFVGLIGVFIASNLMFFYFCWELMLVPTYFIISEWGYKDSQRAAFKFFIFTHAGAVFVLLGIGGIFMVTGDLDLFQAQVALATAHPDIVKWILLSLTAGFAVKMGIVPVHMWLPDAYSEAPAPMSALLSGVITGAGAYAVLRVSIETVFPAVASTNFGSGFLHGLALLGVVSALFGSLIASLQNGIKKVLAYSSISHMGYVLFGLSLFSSPLAIVGVVLHLVNHAVSKGLLFFSAGAVTKQLQIRDIQEMGGLAGRMPITAIGSTTAALSIAAIPPFACFISELLIFVAAFQAIGSDGFYLLPTGLMLIATVLSLAYALRYVSHMFFGPVKPEKVKQVPFFMNLAMIILTVLVIILGTWPTFFINVITAFMHA